MEMLYAYGLAANPEDFQISKGYWAHAHQDCLAWEFSGRMVGSSRSEEPIGIDSWDSISKCAKYGFWLLKGSDGYGQYTAYAKLPGRYCPGTKKPIFKGEPDSECLSEEEFKLKHAYKES